MLTQNRPALGLRQRGYTATMRKLVVFDDGLGQLAPLTDLRAAFDVRTGVATTLERMCVGAELIGLFVPPHLVDLCRERHPVPVNDPTVFAGITDPVLMVNGRLVLPGCLDSIEPGTVLVEERSGHVVGALVAPDQAGAIVNGEIDRLKARLMEGHHLLDRPWHLRTFRDRAVTLDLDRLVKERQPGSQVLGTPPGVQAFGDKPVIIGQGARVYPGAIFDTELGAIVLSGGAVVRPGAIISGPASIGARSFVLERAHIKPFTVIGPGCKVNGEVGGTIFQGYANKAHEGHLGDSYIGEWVNLGAGATNSNLLNTYSEVVARAAPGGPHERTGEAFLGAIIGDHAKFAICTRITTGAVVHTGVMYAASAPVSGCLAPFSWVTDSGSSRFRLDKFNQIARTVMARRDARPSAAYLERISSLHAAGSAPDR